MVLNNSRPIPGARICAGAPWLLGSSRDAEWLRSLFEPVSSVREFRNDDAATVSSGQNNVGTLTDNCQEREQGIFAKYVFSEISAASH